MCLYAMLKRIFDKVHDQQGCNQLLLHFTLYLYPYLQPCCFITDLLQGNITLYKSQLSFQRHKIPLTFIEHIVQQVL
ncbi:hypothetical protein D3C72_1170020 [compost metagenome]